MKKLVIFDLDGTLTNNINLSEIIYREISKKYNLRELSSEEIRRLKSFTSLKQVLSVGMPLFKIPKLYNESREIASEYIADCVLVPGMKELLFRLIDKDIKLAIVSSNSEANIYNFLIKNDINFFSFIRGKASMKGKKKIIKKMIQKNGYQLDEVIYVGDEVRDVRACKLIPIEIASVGWGFETLDILEDTNPNYMVKSIDELERLMLDLK